MEGRGESRDCARIFYPHNAMGAKSGSRGMLQLLDASQRNGGAFALRSGLTCWRWSIKAPWIWVRPVASCRPALARRSPLAMVPGRAPSYWSGRRIERRRTSSGFSAAGGLAQTGAGAAGI